ncbi:MAG: hypothetical protein ACLR6B_17950 [Blautia sp.]
MLAWIFGDCREGLITPLLAAGYLIEKKTRLPEREKGRIVVISKGQKTFSKGE